MTKRIFPLVLFFVISYAMGQKDQGVTEAFAHVLVYEVVNKDILIPVSTVYRYKGKGEAVGSRCNVFVYEDQGHGFLTYGKKGQEYNKKTILEVDRFLRSFGYYKGNPPHNLM